MVAHHSQERFLLEGFPQQLHHQERVQVTACSSAQAMGATAAAVAVCHQAILVSCCNHSSSGSGAQVGAVPEHQSLLP
jgi:hypothetical protein